VAGDRTHFQLVQDLPAVEVRQDQVEDDHVHVFPDGQRGGVTMGYGWGTDWTKVYSTQNNVDYYAVLSMLGQLYASGDTEARSIFTKFNYGPEDIKVEMDGIERWMKEVAYSQQEKTFNAGYNEKGINPTHALDTISWTIAAMGPQKLQEMDIDRSTLWIMLKGIFLL